MTNKKSPHNSSYIRNLLSLAILSCITATTAIAQESTDTDKEPKSLDEIVVTGSRSTNRSATETMVPVDIISREMIEATGASETGRLLQKLAPSFNFPQSFVSDGTDLIWPASLRGMGPDQVLVLINGKRRHQQALVNVQQTIGRGSAGTDINAIPISAIKRIEVLRDGASAQYGSDAIAGVINIILNDQVNGGSITTEVGQTTEGDGDFFRVGVNGGMALGDGFLNLTAEALDRDETNRAGLDTLRVSPPRVTQRIGDADMTSQAIWFNAEIPAGTTEFYAFGGISKRDANSSGFFRSAGDGRTIPALYPNGFLPTLLTSAKDWSVALGIRGDFNDTWKYDVSVNRGFSQFGFATENSANVSWYYEPLPGGGGGIYASTPTSAKDGTLRSTQLTFNADIKGSIDWGIGAEPLYIGAGVEWRRDGYEIIAGDPVSYTYGRTNNGAIFIPNQNGGASAPGIQGFPGFTPGTEVDEDRRSIGVYVDAESKITERFLLGAAVRFEDYSDTGRNQTGKITGRFNVTDAFAFRASASTGVRAPGIQQAFFSQVSTTLGSGGVLTDTVTVRQGSPLSAAFGILPLKEETSKNATLGFVYRPDNGFSLTADLYSIDIDDRIVISGYVTPDGPAGCINPVICPARVLLASVNVGAANFFTNAIDTSTKGIDIIAQYKMDLASGAELIFDAGYSHNETKVKNIKSSSTLLAPTVLFDNTQVNLIENGLPKDRGSLGVSYSQNDWRLGLNNSYFGSVRGNGFGPVYTSKGKWLTDMSVNYAFNKNVSFTIGGNNVFDVYPDKWQNGTPFPELGFTYGWETLPFSLNGASYYLKMDIKFGSAAK